MPLNIENLPLTADPYSHERMSFLRPKNALDLASALQLYLIEQGPREARENWQRAQLANILRFAHERSMFWRERLANETNFEKAKLGSLPILTREDLNRQVAREGCLIRSSDGLQTFEGLTSGSSGVTTRFYQTIMNRQFMSLSTFLNDIMASSQQYYNATHIVYDGNQPQQLKVDERISDLGFEGFLKPRNFREISFNGSFIEPVIKELSQKQIGSLTTYPWIMDMIFTKIRADTLKKYGCKNLILLGGNVEDEVLKECRDANINLRSTYSCNEVGAIGVSCVRHPNYYHVRTTNVVVEMDTGKVASGEKGGNLLITGLHSYATPFIRYEVGDIAVYSKNCPCGYDGPVLSAINGRSKSYIRLANGSLVHFMPMASRYKWLSDYKEYRFIQSKINRIDVHIGGRSEMSEGEKDLFRALIKSIAGDEMEVMVICCNAIDWGEGGKRLPFRCDVP
jgi:phenylacetate-coenzyme A ligase PaaK-like adenylate-forming protein